MAGPKLKFKPPVTTAKTITLCPYGDDGHGGCLPDPNAPSAPPPVVHGAPLPPNPYDLPAPAPITIAKLPPGYRFGPGSLAGLNLGSWGSGLATLGAINAAAAAPTPPPAPSPTLPPAPGTVYPPSAGAIPIVAPVPPSLSLQQGHEALGNPGFVNATTGSAASGHPLGIANSAVLTLAHRLQVQAVYVAKYVSQAAADAILTGAHLAN